MELNELHKIGIIAALGAFSEEEFLFEIIQQGGKDAASTWVLMTEESKEEVRESAKEGLKRLGEILEEALK